MTRRTAYWFGGLWQGAAHLDGRGGRELVFGATAGAHTEYFWVLTWRHGGLVTLRAPGGDDTWVVDGAANIVIGWQRTDSDPAGLLRSRTAERQPSGRIRGEETTYQWTTSGWSQLNSRVFDPMGQKAADRWVGWRIPGMSIY